MRPREGRRDWVRRSCMPFRSLLLVVLLTHPVLAQTGTVPADRPRSRPPSALTGWADWEKGEELLKRIQVPPAPVLSAEEEAKTFKLAPGYRAELVACEPMVQCPIFFEFDPEGRIWVVEYQGYMRDVRAAARAIRSAAWWCWRTRMAMARRTRARCFSTSWSCRAVLPS
jgi:hypothetical protein